MKQTPEVPALPYRSPLGFRLKLVDDQETALPMTPERAAEVGLMYARAEAAAAIVTAAVQWRKYPTNWQGELQTAIDCYNALLR